jgi:hypothetical protein
MASYKQSSPYAITGQISNGALGYLQIRPIPAAGDDVVYTIEPQYNHRPDLLAYDLYNDTKLWWVFAQRNMDIIKDPIYDIEAGTTIFLPQGPNLMRVLSL